MGFTCCDEQVLPAKEACMGSPVLRVLKAHRARAQSLQISTTPSSEMASTGPQRMHQCPSDGWH